jgi:hypothetical protein
MNDLDVWAQALRDKIEPLTSDYRTLQAIAQGVLQDDDADPDIARFAATVAASDVLVKIVEALGEVPALSGCLRDGPMADLIAALEDVRRGLRPNFFNPAPGVRGQLSTKLTMLKMRAAASVLALKRSGMGEAEACREVSKLFSARGHRGKKGGAVSEKTVFSWWGDCMPSHEGTTEQRLIAQTFDNMPEVLSRPEAIALVRAEAAKHL